MSEAYDVEKQNKVRQLREKAAYDKATVHAVLDSGLVATVGFVQDGGDAFLFGQWRQGNLYATQNVLADVGLCST